MLPSELKLASLGHCYVELPATFVSKEPALKPNSTISIRSVQNDIELFVIWMGQQTTGDFAQIDLSFGQANKFQDELVIISLADNLQLKECTVCRVELVETSDHSIISQHFSIDILNTCKLVTKGLIIPIWLSQHVKVLVKVIDIYPDEGLGLLTRWTEMHVERSLNDSSNEETIGKDIPIVSPIPIVSYSLGVGYNPKFVFGSMLVCGERGSGKTHFLETTLHNYRKFHGELFNCKQLRGKRPESIKKKLTELLNNALDKQPSILGLDDIDSIVCGASDHEDKVGQDAIYKKRLVDALCYMFKQLERSEHDKGQKVMIIATCRSIESLDERLCKPGGRKYFNEMVKIINPNLQERVKIIKNIIAQHREVRTLMSDNQIENVAKKCGNYMPKDLRRLVERSIINACSRSHLNFDSEPLEIKFEDFIHSLNDYVPSNLRGVALQEKTAKTFDNVGGMKKIKEILMKTILLQVKYPKLLKKGLIKPQTSILLYGPPGCGKTLVAEALTNQDNLNSICVRGPELLSKYIGASEAAVRDLFKRAELAKPCVIFFDEFESLVSRRGSDSTGVTDRIVNQFLTIMDGVEALSDDIFIIAATSRPDMIDPAILRPGRLDKHIYCPVPDQEERLEILNVLSKDLKIDTDLKTEFPDWSHKLEGFTGADIQSLLYCAQLKALHEILGPSDVFGNKSQDIQENSSKEKLKSDFEIELKQNHMKASFEEMRAEVAIRYVNILEQYPITMRKPGDQVAARATLA